MTKLRKALFEYENAEDDYISFPDGAILEVELVEENGWGRGNVRGQDRIGWFPVNFTEEYEEEEASEESGSEDSYSYSEDSEPEVEAQPVVEAAPVVEVHTHSTLS
ncbi:hypothetical protein KIPB_012738 [Kipferlia bialata]|uniref:SH3 domain-containing protein n=1 Tax=Kipferlia bialata TaxID=797122 RepID=A0A9K3D9E2_9EUKA|nr:hypothetical protein KIPB_012738 [Kipferlia bialata]|eukprot:g12738.t1